MFSTLMTALHLEPDPEVCFDERELSDTHRVTDATLRPDDTAELGKARLLKILLPTNVMLDAPVEALLTERSALGDAASCEKTLVDVPSCRAAVANTLAWRLLSDMDFTQTAESEIHIPDMAPLSPRRSCAVLSICPTSALTIVTLVLPVTATLVLTT